jgi:hypothetical protein
MITKSSIVSGPQFQISQRIADLLGDYFPGYRWICCVDKGMCYIRNLDLHGQWGMSIKLADVDKRRILEAGGEFLERFKQPYAFNEDRYETAPRDFTGSIESEKWTPDCRYYNKYEKRWKA